MAAPERVVRFTRTERLLHWVYAAGFFALLASGLALYLPQLSVLVERRPLVKAVHLYIGIAWLVALAGIALAGERGALRATMRMLDRFDASDRRWLRGRRSESGKFNAGQKLNSALTAAFTVLFAASGFLLWYGERDTRFRFAGTILLHDGLMYVSLVLLVGHLYLSLVHPTTRHALRGITSGSVDVDWARRHHPRWTEVLDREAREAGEPRRESHELAGREQHAERDQQRP